MSDAFSTRRTAGVLLPLFSVRGESDWGLGDLADLPDLCAWLAAAGHPVLQLLPLFEMGAHERSPYAALTAFAIDPIYIALPQVEDFVAAGGEAALPDAIRADLDAIRSDETIPYPRVRRVKRWALELSFAHFEARETPGRSGRARAFDGWCTAQGAWLDDYASFRALKEAHAERAWRAWPPEIAARKPEMLQLARRVVARRRRFHAWVQWIADGQWQRARAAAVRHGIRLYGDMPFLLSHDSADVWARQNEFRLDATVGAPPDVFDPDGQDWGLPPMVWGTMAEGDYAWWRARCRRISDMFDGARIDHVVGYYRMWERPNGGAAGFHPPDEVSQLVLGETLLDVARAAAGAIDLIAEDLGSIPDFVRASLAELRLPGYRVLRWEDDAGVFRDPLAWPTCSVATTGTHDTSSLATWWSEELREDQRAALARVPVFASLADRGASWSPAVHEALLDGLYAARSACVILPFPDAYGGSERINVPSTVADTNWAYRVPWTVTALRGAAGAPLRAALRARAARHGRI